MRDNACYHEPNHVTILIFYMALLSFFYTVQDLSGGPVVGVHCANPLSHCPVVFARTGFHASLACPSYSVVRVIGVLLGGSGGQE